MNGAHEIRNSRTRAEIAEPFDPPPIDDAAGALFARLGLVAMTPDAPTRMETAQ